MNKYFLVLLTFLFTSNLRSQIDTTYLYIEDSSYYKKINCLEALKKYKNTNGDLDDVYVHFSTVGQVWYFNDSLADGYYMLYKLNRKDFLLINNDSLLVEGLFMNKKREGVFKYYTDNSELKIVPFHDGKVHGTIMEYRNGLLVSAKEYSYDVLDGFTFLLTNDSIIKLKYYTKGKEINSTTFW